MNCTFYLLKPDANGHCLFRNVKPHNPRVNGTRNYLYLHVLGVPQKYLTERESRKSMREKMGMPMLDQRNPEPWGPNERIQDHRLYFDLNLIPADKRAELEGPDRATTMVAAQAFAASMVLVPEPTDPWNTALWTTTPVTEDAL